MSTETMSATTVGHPAHTCPWWLGYFLISPLRRLIEDPSAIVLPLVVPGQQVLELGPGLGYFSLPVAKALGPSGRLVCVDVQRAMLDRLRRRLAKARLLERSELRLATHEDSGFDGLDGRVDLALALHVVHETASPTATIAALARTLRPAGRLLIVEPPGHCSRELFRAEEAAADAAGLCRIPHPRLPGRRFVGLWERPTGAR